jgi:hypothetical protein
LISEIEVSILSVAAEVATIWAIVFALPDFFAQKRITDTSAIADKALEVLTEVNTTMDKLYPAFRGGKEDLMADILRELSTLYKKLGKYLRRISQESDMSEYIKKIDQRLEMITMKEGYDHKAVQGYLQYEFGDDFRNIIKRPDVIVSFLNKLEQVLIKIFDVPVPQPRKLCYFLLPVIGFYIWLNFGYKIADYLLNLIVLSFTQ